MEDIMKNLFIFVLVLCLISGNIYAGENDSSFDRKIQDHPLYPYLLRDGILEAGKDNTALFNSLLKNWEEQGYLQDLINEISITPGASPAQNPAQSQSFKNPEIFLDIINPHGVVVAPDNRIRF